MTPTTRKAPAPAPDPVTVKAAAKRLGCSVRTVIYQIGLGHLKAKKFGDGVTSAWLIDPDDLERLARERDRQFVAEGEGRGKNGP